MTSPRGKTESTGSSRRCYQIAMIAACPFPCARGTPIRIFRLAESLAARGHSVHVVTYHLGEPHGELPFHLHRIADVPRYRRLAAGPTPRKLIHLDALLVRTLRRVLSSHPIDIIHAHHYEGLLVGLAGRRGHSLPIVYDAHTILESELPTYRSGLPPALVAGLGRILDGALPRRAQGIVAVSDTIAAHLIRRGARPDRVTVIGNGVELDLFPSEESRLPSSARTIVFAGNLAPYQGIDDLLESVRLVRQRVPETRLQILTNEPFARYEARARQLGLESSVDLIDCSFADLPRHLQKADVLVNPRRRTDGVPQKILNYMAAGRPIVYFSGSRWILEDGATGICAQEETAKGLADAIVRILEDGHLADRLGKAARARIGDGHGWAHRTEEIESVYEQCLRH